MKVNRLFGFFSLLVIIAAFLKIVFHLNFWVIPVVFFVVGLGAGLFNQTFSLYLFIFLFPFINSTPALFDNGYPYNYMAPSLFLLSGIIIAALLKKIQGTKKEPDIEAETDRGFYSYYLFLLFLLISAVFVFLSLSNISLGSTGALGADTPVSPALQRISFGSIFPVVSLFIYFISPYIFFYVKRVDLKEKAIFTWLSYGFFVSVFLGILQKLSGRSAISDRLGKELKQFYGGFSDFNAFGFFSGMMFLWSTYEIKNKNNLGYITFVVSLVGAILSGSRTAFFFIAAGIGNLIFSALKGRKKQQKILVGLLVAAVLLVVIFAGGTLVKRLGEGFEKNESLFDTLDAVTNGRVWMTLFSLETIKDNPLSGVGTGNFTFYLAYKNHGTDYLYDLTLNQYLLVFTENGVLAFIFFAWFMVLLFRRTSKRLLMGVCLFVLLFNNFFWFPEAALLFWILAALNDTGSKNISKRKIPFGKIGAAAAILIVIVSHITGFNSLHPKTWARETGTRYDYGFWYPEQGQKESEFRWTTARAGIYLVLDTNGESREMILFCGAPLTHLEEKTQRVDIYWQGKLYKEIVFTENKAFTFRIKSQPLAEGFLEVRVLPVFNLKKLGLGEETRDLGIRFSGK